MVTRIFQRRLYKQLLQASNIITCSPSLTSLSLLSFVWMVNCCNGSFILEVHCTTKRTHYGRCEVCILLLSQYQRACSPETAVVLVWVALVCAARHHPHTTIIRHRFTTDSQHKKNLSSYKFNQKSSGRLKRVKCGLSVKMFIHLFRAQERTVNTGTRYLG